MPTLEESRAACLMAVGVQISKCRVQARSLELHPERDIREPWMAVPPSQYWREMITCYEDFALRVVSTPPPADPSRGVWWEAYGMYPMAHPTTAQHLAKLTVRAVAKAMTKQCDAALAVHEWATRIEEGRAQKDAAKAPTSTPSEKPGVVIRFAAGE